MLILSDSGVLTATTQLFLLNSIARRQRAAPSWAAAGERLFTTRASISVSYALLARLKPRWYHLRPSRLHRIYYGAVRPWLAHWYFRPRVFSACAFSLGIAGQVLKFRRRARMRVTPPLHRTPHGQ